MNDLVKVSAKSRSTAVAGAIVGVTLAPAATTAGAVQVSASIASRANACKRT